MSLSSFIPSVTKSTTLAAIALTTDEDLEVFLQLLVPWCKANLSCRARIRRSASFTVSSFQFLFPKSYFKWIASNIKHSRHDEESRFCKMLIKYNKKCSSMQISYNVSISVENFIGLQSKNSNCLKNILFIQSFVFIYYNNFLYSPPWLNCENLQKHYILKI